MNRLHSILQVIKILNLLAFTVARWYIPSAILYGNNANMLLFSSLLKTLLILIGGTLVIYILFCIMFHKNPRKASLSSFIFLLFFHTYGIVFSGLRTLDIFQVEHFTLLPVYILMGLYTSLILAKLMINTLEIFIIS